VVDAPGLPPGAAALPNRFDAAVPQAFRAMFGTRSQQQTGAKEESGCSK
jgi:hypothetical protein